MHISRVNSAIRAFFRYCSMMFSENGVDGNFVLVVCLEFLVCADRNVHFLFNTKVFDAFIVVFIFNSTPI